MTELRVPALPMALGDRAPNFVLPDSAGDYQMFYERVRGRPTALIFARDAATATLEALATTLTGSGVDVICIKPEATEAPATMALWADPAGKITEAFMAQTGLGGPSMLADGAVAGVLLDRNQRLLGTGLGPPAELGLRLVAALAAWPADRDGPPDIRRQTAPVLTIPRLLDPDMCQALIRRFQDSDAVEGTVQASDADGEVQRVNHARKKRIDYPIPDVETNRALRATIGRRIAPELEKAFHFSGFTFDRFVLCSYDAERVDRFRLHRDNLIPSTKTRRFAITLNLNGGQYEGGELVFPEYGPDRYKPGDGGAVLFSCSLLHEALPVTKGVRYALLTFLRAST